MDLQRSLCSLIIALFSLLFSIGLAQVDKTLRVGDLVEATYAGDWLPATIVEGYHDTEFGYGAYRVRWEDGTEAKINAEYVRVRKGTEAAQSALNPEPLQPPQAPSQNRDEVLQPGTPVLYRSGGPSWGEAWVVSYDLKKRQYRLQTPSGSGDIVPCHSVHDPGKAADNSFYIGRWEVRITGATSTFSNGADAYRRFSSGMKLPPLEIRPDGTYLWNLPSGTPISGRWLPRKGVPGITLLKGVDGKDWTLFEKTEGYATTAQTRDEIGFHDLESADGYLSGYRVGANRSCVLKGRTFR